MNEAVAAKDLPAPRVRPYVDFYQQESISPVAQDISDLDRHYQRREALYRHLGIVPALLRGRSVIEFGPGSGHNALFTSSLGPSRYVLVEGNPKAVAEGRQLLSQHSFSGVEHEWAASLIEEYRSGETFDLVLCEGVLSWQLDPARLLRRVASFSEPGGVVVITCMDAVGFLPECLRRLMASLILSPKATTAENLRMLTPIFSPHLRTLAGMSRSHEDWVLDNLLFPYHGRMFSIGQAIKALQDDFDVYGSSPRFLTDWRWHKDIHGDNRRYNELALAGYRGNLHTQIDCRYSFGPRDEVANMTLLAHCEQVFELSELCRRTRDAAVLAEILDLLDEISTMIRSFSAPTADALDEYLDAMRDGVDTARATTFQRFNGWFGQGQQYLSFVRRTPQEYEVRRTPQEYEVRRTPPGSDSRRTPQGSDSRRTPPAET